MFNPVRIAYIAIELRETDMPTFLGLMAAIWLILGGLALVATFSSPTGNDIGIIIGVLLMSFGVLFAFAAWVCERISAALPNERQADSMIARAARAG